MKNDKNQKVNQTDALSDYVFGRVQPQALSLEEAVLGALMLDKEAIGAVSTILGAESFYHDHHVLIYEAILNLFKKSSPIDILTVTEELKSMGKIDEVGGPYYIVELTGRVASSANIEYHANIIQQKFIEREIIKVCSEIIRDSYDPVVQTQDLIESAERKIFSITQNGFTKKIQAVSDVAKDWLGDVEKAMTSKDGLTGVPSGFTSLDRVIFGWQKSDLIILAARPGMGKSAFMLSTALNASKFGKGVAIFSLEMSCKQLIGRMSSQESLIDSSKIRSGKISPYEYSSLVKTVERISNLPIFIDDTAALSIYELRAKCRKLKAKKDIQLIIVDYLQLITTGDERFATRDQQVGVISGGLKAIAKELDVPVIALSQLSRAVETRGGSKRPMLSDLRESGNIEQEADMVTFIYRPEYYQIMEDEQGRSTKGVAEIIIAKARHGQLTDVELRFVDKYVQFTDVDAEFQLPIEDQSLHGGISETGDTEPSPTAGIIPNKGQEDIPF